MFGVCSAFNSGQLINIPCDWLLIKMSPLHSNIIDDFHSFPPFSYSLFCSHENFFFPANVLESLPQSLCDLWCTGSQVQFLDTWFNLPVLHIIFFIPDFFLLHHLSPNFQAYSKIGEKKSIVIWMPR